MTTTELDLSTPAVLRRAADIIEAKGLSKHHRVDPETGAVTARRALFMAAGLLDLDYRYDPWSDYHAIAFRTALNAMVDHVGARFFDAWADATERTADEVAAAMRATADALDATGGETR